MKSKDVELTAVASQTAGAEKVIGDGEQKVNPLGKFKDAQTLLQAYESLESEFTRRSQRLKAIEGELQVRSQRDKADFEVGDNNIMATDFNGRYPLAVKYAEKIESEMKGENSLSRQDAYIKILERELGEAENKLSEKATGENIGKEFSEIAVREYLKKVMGAKPTVKTVKGAGLKIPPLKPKSIADASVIAQTFIKHSTV